MITRLNTKINKKRWQNLSKVKKKIYKKYVPKVEHKLESDGASVVRSTEKTIPYLQKMTRSIVEGVGKTVGIKPRGNKPRGNKRTRKHR